MKRLATFSGIVAIAVSIIYLLSRDETVKPDQPVTFIIERLPDYVPVKIEESRVFLDLGLEDFDTVAPSVLEVKSPQPLPKPLREIATVGVGGAVAQIKFTLIPGDSLKVKPTSFNAAKVTPLWIEWPDRTPKHFLGHVRIAVEYDSKGRIIRDSVQYEYPANLGFGSAVKDALRAKTILTKEPTVIVWDLELKYGESPIVKFASSGIEVIK